MSGTRDLAGLVAPGPTTPPDRTVAAPPPRRRTAEREKSPADPMAAAAAPSHMAASPGAEPRPPRGWRSKARRDELLGTRQNDARNPTPPTTVRISVNIPLGCKQWVARQAREQQRFVSEVLIEALDRHGDDASPPSGRVKRVAVPDGTIYNVVLPAHERQRLDDIVARKKTTRSALLTEVLRRAVEP